MATQVTNVPGGLLPNEVTAPIFNKTAEVSAVQSLARQIPLPLVGTESIPVSMDIPAADWVSEGGSKPASSSGVGIKQMRSQKLALLFPVSEEVVRSNPGGLYEQLQQDLPVALARAFDHAAIHGKSLRTGNAGPFSDYLLKGASSIELGTAAQNAGGLYADLVNGELAVTTAGFDYTGFAGDPILKPTLKLATDTTGRPLSVEVDNSNTIIGYPAVFNRGVSGKYRRSGNRVQVVTITGTPTGGTFTLQVAGQTTAPIAYNAAASAVQSAIRALSGVWSGATVTGSGPYTITLSASVGGAAAAISADGSGLTGGTNVLVTVAQSPDTDSKLRAVGGDWSQAAWGQGLGITMKVSDVASFTDENGTVHSAFQENLVVLLIEASYGFVTSGVPGAFVAYTNAS